MRRQKALTEFRDRMGSGFCWVSSFDRRLTLAGHRPRDEMTKSLLEWLGSGDHELYGVKNFGDPG